VFYNIMIGLAIFNIKTDMYIGHIILKLKVSELCKQNIFEHR